MLSSIYAFGAGREGLVQVSRGESYSMVQVAETIAALAGLHKRKDVQVLPVSRPMDVKELRGSPASLLKALPGFEFTSLEEGLAATFAYYKQQV